MTLLLLSGRAFAGVLLPGQGLSAGQSVYSDNNIYHATMQTDGNFVVYTNTGEALWSTNTTGLGANYAVMQADGNFVLYNRSTGRALWSSNTTYKKNGYAAVSDYGQFIVYSVTSTWSSNTSDLTTSTAPAALFGQNNNLERGANYTVGKYTLTFQTDGNVVIYNMSRKALWSTNTRMAGATLAAVDRGHLIVGNGSPGVPSTAVYYDSPNPTKYVQDPEWQSAYLAFQSDGNLVMYVPQRAFKSPSRFAPAEAPRHQGPSCYGPPEECTPFIIPIFSFPW